MVRTLGLLNTQDGMNFHVRHVAMRNGFTTLDDEQHNAGDCPTLTEFGAKRTRSSGRGAPSIVLVSHTVREETTMIEALVLLTVMCLSALVVCTLADNDGADHE